MNEIATNFLCQFTVGTLSDLLTAFGGIFYARIDVISGGAVGDAVLD